MDKAKKKADYLEKATAAEKEAARMARPEDKAGWERIARVYHRLADGVK
jgi:hypothetical protein